jgi:hypothetical protein
MGISAEGYLRCRSRINRPIWHDFELPIFCIRSRTKRSARIPSLIYVSIWTRVKGSDTLWSRQYRN